MIRLARPEDAERLLTLGAKMHAESIYSTISYDKERARKELLWCLEHGLVAVCDVGLPVGYVMGYVKRPWFSSDLVGFEEALYLSPDHRSGRNAARLIEFWLNWCTSRGAKLIHATTSCGVSGADRLYEAMGLTPVGKTFAKDVV